MLILKSVSEYQNTWRRNNGFTLLEVMISVSIIALIVVSLFRMQAGSVSLATANEFNRLAPVLAGRLMAQISQDPDEWSEKKGDFGDTYPGISWRCDVSDGNFENTDLLNAENMAALKKIQILIEDSTSENIFTVTGWRVAGE